MAHRFHSYEPVRGDIPQRMSEVLISMDKGSATAYRIDKLQDRGRFFVNPGDEVYEGMVIGENSRDNDMVVNITEGKQLTNFRTTSKDDAARIAPATKFRSEEHTSELQSLMRISYAVFCLKQ